MSRERNYRVVVPTRDSAGWIEAFAGFYRGIGIEPLYLYDTRSLDTTLSILRHIKADVIPVEPKFDRVESMLSFTQTVIQTKWVVRFDDDELPSLALIEWLDSSLVHVKETSLALSRRDALFVNGNLCFSRLEDYYFHPKDPTYLDPQLRVFQPGNVNFIETIHTPGFDASHSGTAPVSAFFVHFDWILCSFRQRLAKLERYERQSPGAGWGLAQYYLPELHAHGDMRWTVFETSEFKDIASRLTQISAEAN